MILKLKMPKKMKNRQKKIGLPALKLWGKMLIYMVTILLAMLSIMNAIHGILPHFVGIVFYVLAALILPVACMYLAFDFRYSINKMKPEIESNPFMDRMAKDYRYRTMVFAVPGLVLNLVFAIFHGVVGVVSHSAWFGTLAAYYILLSIMRFLAVRYDRRSSNMMQTKELVLDEISVYRNCGFLFMVMTAALGGAVILLLNSKGGKHYPGFTIYAVAAYTFYKIIISVINMLKAGKLNSPILMTIRSVGYIDACVSVLSLQTAMFASFAKETEDTTKLMNGMTGTVVCLMVLSVGVHCVCSSRKMKIQLETGGMGNDSCTCSGG